MQVWMLTLFLVLPSGELQEPKKAHFTKSEGDCIAYAIHEMQMAAIAQVDGTPAWTCKKVPEAR